jgi:hypothetical protein
LPSAGFISLLSLPEWNDCTYFNLFLTHPPSEKVEDVDRLQECRFLVKSLFFLIHKDRKFHVFRSPEFIQIFSPFLSRIPSTKPRCGT